MGSRGLPVGTAALMQQGTLLCMLPYMLVVWTGKQADAMQVLLDFIWVWAEAGPEAFEESQKTAAPINPLVLQIPPGC